MVKEASQRFVAISIAFLPIVLFIRLGEFIALSSVHILPPGSYRYELLGCLSDITLFLFLGLILFLPYFLLFMIHRKAAAITLVAVYTLVALLWMSLVKYFITTLVPLDQVVFSYTFDEMIMIVRSSTRFTLMSFLPFIVFLILVPLAQYLVRNYNPGKAVRISALILLVLSPLLNWAFLPRSSDFSRDFNYFLAVNKVQYLVGKTQTYRASLREPEIPDARIREAIDRYQANNPHFTYVSKTYPLLREDQTRDVLGDYFRPGTEKPNLVFIIVESLSSAFCGDNPWFGSWTPFLDSLIDHSLYWKNCLATSERTFYVLPGIFGSLPYANERFLGDPTRTSYHLSLIRYLRQNGYHASFFYGGDPSFNQMKEFLTGQETDYMLGSFGSRYTAQTKAESGFTWGYPDHEMFERSFEVMDSFPQAHRLDIYLTLSMHAPFIPPSQDIYRQKYLRRLGQISTPAVSKRELGKYRSVFETILYTDDALRSFFREYAKRKDFGNTIFIITGDHALPELNVGQISLIEKYRVPLIIYSPSLKQGIRFPSVVSHLDITPSLLAMLRQRYDVKTHSSAPWLGRELDTASSFDPKVRMAFALNNKEVVEYLDGPYYLTPDRLFRVTPTLETNSVREPERETRMRTDLAEYLVVTNYAGDRNALIPIRMIFPEKIREKPLPFADTLSLPKELNSGEYITVLPATTLDTTYKILRMDVSYRMFTGEKDYLKFPPLIFNIIDREGKHVVWRQFIPSRDAVIIPSGGSWYTLAYKADVHISFVKKHADKRLKLYLWNQQGIQVQYDSLNITINGFY